MKRLYSNLKNGNVYDFSPKRILFGKTERERKAHFKSQFDLLIKYWDKLPLRQWGVGSARNLSNLLREIGSGETVLTSERGELIRNVDIVIVFLISKNGRWLTEDHQQMVDGRIRNRRFPYISEKLRLGENSVDTALRAITEETGGHIIPNKKRLVEGEVHLLDENHAYNTGSSSYPGLKSIKKAYTFAYIVSKKEYRPRYTEVDVTGSVTIHSWKKVKENFWFTGTLLEDKVQKFL